MVACSLAPLKLRQNQCAETHEQIIKAHHIMASRTAVCKQQV